MFLLTLTVLFLKDEPDEKVMKKYDQKYDAKVIFTLYWYKFLGNSEAVE